MRQLVYCKELPSELRRLPPLGHYIWGKVGKSTTVCCPLRASLQLLVHLPWEKLTNLQRLGVKVSNFRLKEAGHYFVYVNCDVASMFDELSFTVVPWNIHEITRGKPRWERKTNRDFEGPNLLSLNVCSDKFNSGSTCELETSVLVGEPTRFFLITIFVCGTTFCFTFWLKR